MVSRPTPDRPAPLRRLGAELRLLRKAQGLQVEDVATATRIHKTSLHRLEKAEVRPQVRTLVTLLDFFNVSELKRERLLNLVAAAKNSEDQPWWTAGSKIPSEYGEYTEFIGFEAEAREIRNYESLYVPGLLQTADYAREATKGGARSASSDDVEVFVGARMARQRNLSKESPLQLSAIMDEAALRRRVGGASIMRDQLIHLLDAAATPNVTLQVVPFDAGSYPGMQGSFVHMTFEDPQDPELVYTEHMTGDLFLESPKDIARYATAFADLQGIALSPDETVRMITELADGIR